MISTIKSIFVPVALLLAIVFAIGLAQADDKTHGAKKHDKTATLKITKAGTGEATITSFPVGIDCGNTCRAEFNSKSTVTLTATAATGSTFKRWGGACKGTAATCTVTLKEAQNVTAITDLLPITLNVSKTGSGTGSVTSLPAGIDCGNVCSASYSPKFAAHGDDLAHSRQKEQKQEHKDEGKDKKDEDKDKDKGKDKNKDKNKDDDDPTNDDDNEDHEPSQKPAVVVTLTATPATGSLFSGWSGACTGSAATCTVTLNQSQAVTVHFALLPMTLTAAKTGNGTGTLSSLQTGIDCGASCSASYDWGTAVTLTATPATGSTFDGWTGACTGTTSTCTVPMDQAQQISARFSLQKMTLTAAQTGSGRGTVTSSPIGIDCGTTCSGIYDWGSAVTLTATAAEGSTFNGWGGACTGNTATCTVTLEQNQSVSADFIPAFKTLSLAKIGSGTGTVASTPPGLDCGATCSASFATGTVITLTATPADGSTFTGWFGACTGTAPTCTVTLSQAASVQAGFSTPAVTTFYYDPNGNLTQITDPLGQVRQYQYDALNQAVRQLEPDPAVPGSTLGRIDTSYDSLGQIIAITDPRNLTTTYTTDSLGNLKQQNSPDSGVTEAGHDEAGNLTSRTDARGQTARYQYDSLNRLIRSDDGEQTVTYTWDSCANGSRRLCSVSNATASLAYRYDSHGRITSQSQTAGATTLTVTHTYNAAGQRVQTLTPGGQTLDYHWTGQRLTALDLNGQAVISQIRYDPDGQVNGWLWGNNQANERLYDLAGRPVAISLGFDAHSRLPDHRLYDYDAAGRLTGILADSDPSLNQRYDYDPLDRLIGSERGASTPNRTDYRYDLNGNRTDTSQDNTVQDSHRIDPNSNRLQSQTGAQTVSYRYDPSGNLLDDGSFSYTYNAAGRRIATTHTTTGQTSHYVYNALGQRISKTVAGTTSQYAYDEQGHLSGEYDGSGQPIQELLWLGDLPIAVLKPATSTSATADIYYIHADHLGTPRKITRPGDNRVLWSWESEAFGNSLPDQNPSGLGEFVFNLRFPGQYYDQETGLHYNMARYYNPRTGRYDESDPIGLRGGINTYSYVLNNPLTHIDPLGLDTISLSTNIQIPTFIAESLTGVEGFGGIHSGVAIEFPGPNGGHWDFGGFFGADFAQSVGLGKSTLNLGWDKGTLCDLSSVSGEVSALLGTFEGGISVDPQTNSLQGLHAGVGLAPGKIFKFLNELAKGNSLANAYLNNMISIGGSKNVRVSSFNNSCGCK